MESMISPKTKKLLIIGSIGVSIPLAGLHLYHLVSGGEFFHIMEAAPFIILLLVSTVFFYKSKK